MIVLQLSPHDYKGGAARIAWYLFEGYQHQGIESYFAVGVKTQEHPNLLQIDHQGAQKLPFLWKARKWAEIMMGRENFNYPATPQIPDLAPVRPDLIHAHNLQGKFFDLRALPAISWRYPTLLTLHDNWTFTGHCAYFVECARWKSGCGKCPDLERPPQVLRDATAYNWSRKKSIYARSQLYLATPSQWLMDQVHQSMLMPGVRKTRVIHNGVDTSVFKPADRHKVRNELGLPQEAFILVYVVASRMKKNAYKDFETIDGALNHLQTRLPRGQKVIFLGLGEAAETEAVGDLEKRFIPYQQDILQVARYYQAADIYLHAARADTFPNAILEALACGTPVVATQVGGVPEQVRDGQTGFLVPAGDSKQMASRVLALMEEDELLSQMSAEAASDAVNRFTIERMVAEYIDFHQEILATWEAPTRHA